MSDIVNATLTLDSLAEGFEKNAQRLLAGFSTTKIGVGADGLSVFFRATVSDINATHLDKAFKSYTAHGFLPQTTTLRFDS